MDNIYHGQLTSLIFFICVSSDISDISSLGLIGLSKGLMMYLT